MIHSDTYGPILASMSSSTDNSTSQLQMDVAQRVATEVQSASQHKPDHVTWDAYLGHVGSQLTGMQLGAMYDSSTGAWVTPPVIGTVSCVQVTEPMMNAMGTILRLGAQQMSQWGQSQAMNL